jgi:hypothetical protein
MRTWWLLALLAACGDDDASTEDGARSGSRLRITWIDFDGVRQWQPEEGRHDDAGRLVNDEVYFDRERDESCAAEPWLDGVVRCTPDVELVPRKLFTDAACTTRVTDNPQTYRYVADYDDKCGVRRLWHVFPVVRTVPVGQVYYIALDGKCYPASTMSNQLGVLGDELAPDVFARLDIRNAPQDQRVAVRSRVGDDGLALPLALHDALLGPAVVAHGETDVAAPRESVSATGSALFFADDACTRAYVRVDRGCPAPPSAVTEAATYVAIGERASSSPMYAHPVGACERLASPPDGDFFELLTDSPIALASLTVTRADHPAHRLAVQHATTGHATLRLRELFDITLGGECVPRRFADDVIRCAPDPAAAALVPGLFADAACQMRLYVARVLPGHRPPGIVMDDQAVLGGPLTFNVLGERYTETAYTWGGADGVTCVPVDVGEAYRVGRAVDRSELVVGTAVTD